MGFSPQSGFTPQGGYAGACLRSRTSSWSASESDKSPRASEVSVDLKAAASSPVVQALEAAQPMMMASPLRPVRLRLDAEGQKAGVRKARLCGAMLKQKQGSDGHWQLRHFEVSGGRLTWWVSPREKQTGCPHKNELDLQGLKMTRKSDTKFELQTQSTMRKQRVY